jgi:hypothetical protein
MAVTYCHPAASSSATRFTRRIVKRDPLYPPGQALMACHSAWQEWRKSCISELSTAWIGNESLKPSLVAKDNLAHWQRTAKWKSPRGHNPPGLTNRILQSD